MQRGRRSKPRTRAGAKSDHIQSSDSFIFWRGDARAWPLARGSAAETPRPSQCWVRLPLLPARAVALRLQVIGGSPFADADARLQTIFVRRAEMNTTIQTAHCRFLRRSEARWKAAVDAGQKIGAGCERQIVCAVKQTQHSRGCAAEAA